jgi:hypothetical protein
MPIYLKKFLILTTMVFLFSCVSTDINDYPVKNVHENPDVITQPTSSETTNDTIPKNPKSPTPQTSSLLTTEERTEYVNLNSLEIQKYAYELGLDPKKELTETEKKSILLRRKRVELEKTLDSEKERTQYSKVLPWLKDDEEKLNLLAIQSLEGRQVWINKQKIWSRVKDLKNYDDVIESQDIALGMPAEYVKKSWGEPTQVDHSGNPLYKNELWHYSRQISTPQGYKQEKRMVYFEGGRVVGWETE